MRMSLQNCLSASLLKTGSLQSAAYSPLEAESKNCAMKWSATGPATLNSSM